MTVDHLALGLGRLRCIKSAPIFSDNTIRAKTDCGYHCGRANFIMAKTISNHVTLDDKLHVLRKLDHRRKWKSLDDRRFCLCCKRVFNGRQVEIAGGTRPLGPLRLICPTENCPSVPADWVYPDESLADRPCRRDVAAPVAA
jgi:hypothetical protein